MFPLTQMVKESQEMVSLCLLSGFSFLRHLLKYAKNEMPPALTRW